MLLGQGDMGGLRCDILVPEGFLTLPPCSGRHFKKECLCVAGILLPLQGGAGKAPSSGTSLGKGFGSRIVAYQVILGQEAQASLQVRSLASIASPRK